MTKDVELAEPANNTPMSGASEKPGIEVRRSSGAGMRNDVIVNVRFLPNGLVNFITNQPQHMSPQAWFDHLCRMAPEHYRALSGGRGSFCINGDEFAAINEAAHNHR